MVALLAAGSFAAIMLFAAAAPANVQEQRARLPPPAEDCSDPVAGVWMSHAYYPYMAQWYIFTLTVRRTAGSPSRLEGQIHSHYWSGNETNEQPPPCDGLGFHRTVIMPAIGSVDPSGRIEFNGTSWQHENAFCGGATSGYNPDRFSGTIDRQLMEFQSVNNDGGAMINVPTVFRRVRCLDSTPPPPTQVQLRPPPFQPPGGCSCSN